MGYLDAVHTSRYCLSEVLDTVEKVGESQFTSCAQTIATELSTGTPVLNTAVMDRAATTPGKTSKSTELLYTLKVRNHYGIYLYRMFQCFIQKYLIIELTHL